jgi:EAL domain-containing protein (putative c-di-GMP-specific phosphodiesterase class I)
LGQLAVRPTPPKSNRLSDAPNAGEWGKRDSQNALEKMVGTEHLSVVFQPVVRLDTGTVFGYEALVRCRLPEYRNPLVLFQQAVATGCAGRLGRLIREIAVPLCSDHRLFLNVHPQELHESWIVRPDDPIFAHDHETFIEVTESVPLTHFDLCLNVLKEVRSRGGISLVVDDLGAGVSNLKRVVDLEPQVVKLDRELIAGIHQNRRQQKLVARLLGLCSELKADAIAEGVETADELAALRDVGLHLAQGYLFARPSFPLPESEYQPK